MGVSFALLDVGRTDCGPDPRDALSALPGSLLSLNPKPRVCFQGGGDYWGGAGVYFVVVPWGDGEEQTLLRGDPRIPVGPVAGPPNLVGCWREGRERSWSEQEGMPPGSSSLPAACPAGQQGYFSHFHWGDSKFPAPTKHPHEVRCFSSRVRTPTRSQTPSDCVGADDRPRAGRYRDSWVVRP